MGLWDAIKDAAKDTFADMTKTLADMPVNAEKYYQEFQGKDSDALRRIIRDKGNVPGIFSSNDTFRDNVPRMSAAKRILEERGEL